MRVHKEMREVTSYALTIAKKGPKLKEAEKVGVTEAPALGLYATSGYIGTGALGGDLGQLAKTLTLLVGRPVIDERANSREYVKAAGGLSRTS
jgi:uncharacterized protein (TIGR03435 family)